MPSLMLAHHYNNENISGWFMSRKLNGFRASFRTGKLWTLGRYSGEKEINAPNWFLEQCREGFDGELWHQSDNIAEVKSICGQGINGKYDNRWNTITYCVFDMWSNPWTWDMRQKQLKLIMDGYCHPNVRLHEQLPAENIYGYLRSLGDVEGIMLANPNGYYETKRSRNLLKVKNIYETEAVVIGTTDGEGKHSGRLGALMVELVWDSKVLSVYGGDNSMVGRRVVFNVGGGFSNADRAKPWPIGTEIRFSYLGVTQKGTPVSPNFLEVV